MIFDNKEQKIIEEAKERMKLTLDMRQCEPEYYNSRKVVRVV